MQDALFPLPPADTPQPDPNPMVQCYGSGPDGAKCKTCRHLVVKEYYPNKYHKCKFRKQTNGLGTDHRVRWNACAKYEPKE